MRKPTKIEVLAFIEVVNKISKPKTEKGVLRVVAKYFHTTSKDISSILAQ